jgi:hypothetical protein
VLDKAAMKPPPVTGGPPKSTVPLQVPESTICPAGARTSPAGRSNPSLLPNRFDQTWVPFAAKLAMNRSGAVVEALVSGPPPKSIVPTKYPVS